MVLIHISKSTEEFIYETSVKTSVDVVTRDIATLHNLRLRVKRLSVGLRELAKHGPQKPDAERGLSEEQVSGLGVEESKRAAVSPDADPLGNRVGIAPPKQLQATLNQVAAEAEEAVSNNHAKLRRPLSLARIHECLQNCRGAVMMSYPAGLPEFDSVRCGIEDDEDLGGTEDSKHVLDPASAALWFAGKCMDRSDVLSKYIGQNEKVTIKARIEPRGGNAPQREPAVDEETRQKMMSHWHKKEAETAKLDDADEDSYLNSVWANPKGFKQNAQGLGEIKFRPGGR